MAKIKFKVLTNNQKYLLADTFAALFPVKQYTENIHGKYIFREVCNLRDDSNTILTEQYGEEQSYHIANLVKRRLFNLFNNEEVRFVGNFDSLLEESVANNNTAPF